jgi:electron transfer flavoprotein beta subunit
MAAKKKEIKELALVDLGVSPSAVMKVLSYEAPPARKAGVKVGSVEELVQKLHNEAKVI